VLWVLEGCDGTGKSTLARNLAGLFEARIVHCSCPYDHEFFSELIDKSKEYNIIADRFCYGQFVYQEIADRRLTWSDLTRLERRMIQLGAKVIFVDEDTKVVKDRLSKRKENMDVDKIRKGFKELFERTLIVPVYWKSK